jgi:hypothetical protein
MIAPPQQQTQLEGVEEKERWIDRGFAKVSLGWVM